MTEAEDEKHNLGNWGMWRETRLMTGAQKNLWYPSATAGN